jgi:hypothetical protein
LEKHLAPERALKKTPVTLHCEFFSYKQITPGAYEFDSWKLATQLVKEFSNLTAKKTGHNNSFWIQFPGNFSHYLRANQASASQHQD